MPTKLIVAHLIALAALLLISVLAASTTLAAPFSIQDTESSTGDALGNGAFLSGGSPWAVLLILGVAVLVVADITRRANSTKSRSH